MTRHEYFTALLSGNTGHDVAEVMIVLSKTCLYVAGTGFIAWMLVSEDCPVQRISCDAHADRASEFHHAVEHLDRDFDLTYATRVFT